MQRPPTPIDMNMYFRSTIDGAPNESSIFIPQTMQQQQSQQQANPSVSKDMPRRIHVKLHTAQIARSHNHSPTHSHDVLQSMQFLATSQQSQHPGTSQFQHQFPNSIPPQSLSLHSSFLSTPHQSPPPRCHFQNVSFDPPPSRKHVRLSIEEAQSQPFSQLKRGITLKKSHPEKFSLNSNDVKMNLIVSNLAPGPTSATNPSNPFMNQLIARSQGESNSSYLEPRPASQLSKRAEAHPANHSSLTPQSHIQQQQSSKPRVSSHFSSRRASTSLSQRRQHQQHLQQLQQQQQSYLDDFIPVLHCVDGQEITTPAIISFKRLIQRPFSQQSQQPSLSSSSSFSSSTQQQHTHNPNSINSYISTSSKSKGFLLNNVVTSIEDHVELLKQTNASSLSGSGPAAAASAIVSQNMSFYSGDQRRKKQAGNSTTNDFLHTKQLKNPSLLLFDPLPPRNSSADSFSHHQQQSQQPMSSAAAKTLLHSDSKKSDQHHHQTIPQQEKLKSNATHPNHSIDEQLEQEQQQQHQQLQSMASELSNLKQKQQLIKSQYQQQQSNQQPNQSASPSSQTQLRVGIPLKSHTLLSADSSPVGRRHAHQQSIIMMGSPTATTPMMMNSVVAANSTSTTPTGSFHNRNVLKKHHLVRNIQDIEQFKKSKRQQMFQFVYESPTKQQRAAAAAAAVVSMAGVATSIAAAPAPVATIATGTPALHSHYNGSILRNSQLTQALRCVEVFNI